MGCFFCCLVLMIYSLTVPPSAQAQSPTPTPTPSKQAPAREPLWKRVLRIAGLTATTSTQKGPGDEIVDGEIWIADLTTNKRSRLTTDSGYRSPIFLPGDQSLLALRGDEVVQIPLAGGPPRTLFTIKQLSKLVGASLDDPDKVLALSEDANQHPTVNLLSIKDGQLTSIPFDEASREDRRMVIQLQGWERVYGDTKVYLRSETKTGIAGATDWIDVYVKQGDQEPVNVSKCEGRNCGHPSLSQNKQLVAYIKAG